MSLVAPILMLSLHSGSCRQAQSRHRVQEGSLQTFDRNKAVPEIAFVESAATLFMGPETPLETGKGRACTRPLLHDRFGPGAPVRRSNDMLLSCQPSGGALLHSLAPLPGGGSP